MRPAPARHRPDDASRPWKSHPWPRASWLSALPSLLRRRPHLSCRPSPAGGEGDDPLQRLSRDDAGTPRQLRATFASRVAAVPPLPRPCVRRAGRLERRTRLTAWDRPCDNPADEADVVGSESDRQAHQRPLHEHVERVERVRGAAGVVDVEQPVHDQAAVGHGAAIAEFEDIRRGDVPGELTACVESADGATKVALLSRPQRASEPRPDQRSTQSIDPDFATAYPRSMWR